MRHSIARVLTSLVLATVAASATPARGDMLYVSSFGNDRVYQLDAASGTVLKTFTAPSFLDSPTGLALSPDGSTLYVGATNSSNQDVHIFDTTSGARIGDLSNPSFTGARGLALSGDGGTLYVSTLGGDNVLAFNTATGTSTTAVSGLSNPQGIELAPDGNSLFIANTSANNAVRRALPSGATLETYVAPGSFYSPSDIELSPDGSTLYVSTFGDSSTTNNQILRYDAETGSFLGSWTVPAPDGDLYGLAINPDGSTLFVADVFNSRLLTVDTSTGIATPFSTSADLNGPAFLLYAPTPAAVPEPGSLALTALLGGIGLAGGAIRKRRQRQQAA